MKLYKINSIFLSHEGEGIHLGFPQIFIRFQGCSIGCKNCDTPEAIPFNLNKNYSLKEKDLLKKITEIRKKNKLKLKRISITGGDPLDPRHRENVLNLIMILKQKGYFINIEASGNVIVKEIFDLVDSISFDYKTPSSGIKTSLKLIKTLIKDPKYSSKLQIKSVVESKKDFLYLYDSYLKILKTLNELKIKNFSNWIITPCYSLQTDEKTFINKFKQIFKWNLTSGGLFRVIGQQHKWIYGSQRKNV
ncbi:MAG: 7-carboxy-7-deazaguanine synthase QueE [Oligoflexia bacterium]|nr:7-carboxy-7-deazaguanine synthase QueE [Oligoflexia bacterium]